MNLHYKKEFADQLRSGKKKHTIRQKEVAAGAHLKHIIYPYQREKRECVLENDCRSTQRIEILPQGKYFGEGIVRIDGRELIKPEIQTLACNDGFKCHIAFWLYFTEPFTGYIIHWTDARY